MANDVPSQVTAASASNHTVATWEKPGCSGPAHVETRSVGSDSFRVSNHISLSLHRSLSSQIKYRCHQTRALHRHIFHQGCNKTIPPDCGWLQFQKPGVMFVVTSLHCVMQTQAHCQLYVCSTDVMVFRSERIVCHAAHKNPVYWVPRKHRLQATSFERQQILCTGSPGSTDCRKLHLKDNKSCVLGPQEAQTAGNLI
jgi:hypothetical protein